MQSLERGCTFGTDGWRGLMDGEVNPRSVELVAQAFADYLTGTGFRHGVAVGFDGRRNSSGFARLFARVLSANGVEVFLSDAVVPTPVLSYFVHARKLAAGVMITASHNPPEYNGVKFKAWYGGPFLTGETEKVESLIGRNPVKRAEAGLNTLSLLHDYVMHVERFVDLRAIERAGFSIVVDSMGGAGETVLQNILARHGCTVRTIFATPVPDFAGRSPEPIEKNLAPLMAELQRNRAAAVGFATDGDADRVGVVMDGGEWLSAQETILFLTDHIICRRKAAGNIVKTSSVTDKMRTLFERDGRKVHDVQVGFKYICEKMTAEPIAIGCEESGGYGFGGHIPERDGILSSLLLLEMLAVSGCERLSLLAAMNRKKFGPLHYDRVDVHYDAPDRTDILPRLSSRLPGLIAGFPVIEVKNFNSSRGIVNGVKFVMEGDCRWLLLRASETEPVVRIYAEGKSNAEVSALLQAGKQLFGC